jgi:hypothetical protein
MKSFIGDILKIIGLLWLATIGIVVAAVVVVTIMETAGQGDAVNSAIVALWRFSPVIVVLFIIGWTIWIVRKIARILKGRE